VKRLDVVRRFLLFRFGIVHRDRLTPEMKRAYLAPNPTAASRTGVLIFLREIPTGPSDPVSHFWGELEDGLERHFRDKPVGIAWGMRDAAFTPAVLDELWLGTFPHAVVMRVPDAGALARGLGRLFRLPGFTFGHLRYVTTDAVESAPVAADRSSYPVLLFLHGFNGFRQMNTFQVEDLVSHGYIVAAIDQPYAAAAVVFPGGRQAAAGSIVPVEPVHDLARALP
jgi:hypothetical protein